MLVPETREGRPLMDYTPSRFVQKTLLPDERCVRDARFSWMYTLNAGFVCVLCVAAGYVVRYGLSRYMGQDTWQPVYAGAFVGLWMLLSMMMKKWTTEIILTTERLIYKHGFFKVTVQEVDIEQLASDSVAQSLLGRILDYGEIHVRCIEASDVNLPAITRPYEFRNALEQQKHHYRETYMKSQRLRQRGAQPGDK
jgi:hypothetical protein